MKFNVTKTSNPYESKTIEINSLEELMEFIKKAGEVRGEVIINSDNNIEIYDDWRE